MNRSNRKLHDMRKKITRAAHLADCYREADRLTANRNAIYAGYVRFQSKKSAHPDGNPK